MQRKALTLPILAVLHLLVVFLGAAELDFAKAGKAGRLLALYASATGADHGYGFFAPGVGGQLRARFTLTSGGGEAVHTTLESGASHEAQLRIQNIVTQFRERVKDETLRRAITASWAGKILARFPRAHQVLVQVESYDPPEMGDWRAGLRSGWEPFYTAKFERVTP